MEASDAIALIEAKLAAHQLVGMYAMCLNHRDWDQMETLLREDLVWNCSAPVNLAYDTRAPFMKMLRENQTYMSDWIFQMPHGMVFDQITPSEAHLRHTLHVMGTGSQLIGIYYDHVVREADGAWRFARRDYQITWQAAEPTPGAVFRKFPEALGRPDWYYGKPG